jgi:hypothetical protein
MLNFADIGTPGSAVSTTDLVWSLSDGGDLDQAGQFP